MTQGRNGELRAMQGNQMAIDSESVSPWDEGPSWMQHYRSECLDAQNSNIEVQANKAADITQSVTLGLLWFITSIAVYKQSNSCHTNSNSNVKINVQTQKISTVVKNKLYETLEKLAIRGIPDSSNGAGFINRNRSRNNLQYYRKKDCVENRYAKWKSRIQMLGKRDNTGTPRLPKIEICWL